MSSVQMDFNKIAVVRFASLSPPPPPHRFILKVCSPLVFSVLYFLFMFSHLFVLAS